jgi:hypothetical protein
MGYNAFVFKLHLPPWLDAGWRKPGARLLEFGAREFTPDAADSIASCVPSWARRTASPSRSTAMSC